MNVIATLGLGIVGVALLVVVTLFLRAMPRANFVLWAFTLFFVPIWIGASAGTFWAAITVVTLLAIVAGGKSVQLHPADAFIVLFALFVLGQFAIGITSLSGAAIAILEWVIPYVWGRLVLSRVEGSFVTRCLAAFATAAAVFAILEFAPGTNFFLQLPAMGPSFEVWGKVQMRGGFVRAEGAFGHSIALGASLAIGSAFVIASPWRSWIKVLALSAIAIAIVVTFSRIGLITFVLTLAISIVTLPGITRATRITVTIAGLIAAIIVVPFVSAVLFEAGTEASGSAAYRTGLLDLLPYIQLLGAAPNLEGLTVGGQYLGEYAGSIDNALLVVALRTGWIPTVLLVVGLVIAIAPIVVPGRANPAMIAVAAQIPALFAVAFITQYGPFFWFAVGLAVTWDQIRKSELQASAALTEAVLTPPARAGVTA